MNYIDVRQNALGFRDCYTLSEKLFLVIYRRGLDLFNMRALRTGIFSLYNHTITLGVCIARVTFSRESLL